MGTPGGENLQESACNRHEVFAGINGQDRWDEGGIELKCSGGGAPYARNSQSGASLTAFALDGQPKLLPRDLDGLFCRTGIFVPEHRNIGHESRSGRVVWRRHIQSLLRVMGNRQVDIQAFLPGVEIRTDRSSFRRRVGVRNIEE